MKLLVIAPLPMTDRASGDLRLFRLLESLVGRHQIDFCPVGVEWQLRDVGASELERYCLNLENIGVRLLKWGVHATLRTGLYDQVWIEFFSNAIPYLEFARTFQPRAQIVVDTVDVHYIRLLAKAKLTRLVEDERKAYDIRRQELGVYRVVDGLIAVTAQDADALRDASVHTPTFIVPNVHPCQALADMKSDDGPNLIFVGSFRHSPNVDAVVYFCHEILPLIQLHAPRTTVTIVGDAPTDEVRALASDRVTVTGFVPSTEPYLRTGGISIAPLRFGAGMKGKIGEAMSYGLPVVSTAVGAEGFGFVPGEQLLVADDSASFAQAVLALHSDRSLYERIRRAGHAFIESSYGPAAVGRMVLDAVDRVSMLQPRPISLLRRTKVLAADFYARRIAWRFGG